METNLLHRPPPIMILQQLDILYVGIIGVMVTTPGIAPKAASISKKKLYNRLRINTAAATSMDSTLGFYITDEFTGTRFLVDTGALCSIYPSSNHERHIIDTGPLCLAAANWSSLTSHSTKDIQLRFAGHTYSWSFRLAQVNQPLLGTDFWLTITSW